MFYDAIVSGSISGISGRHMFFVPSGFGNDQENYSIILLGHIGHFRVCFVIYFDRDYPNIGNYDHPTQA